MGAINESTFQGYIASTHDALLIFECVRRGMMPKVTRRLREEERGLIRSGQVFVFDEQESGIKRWTDGLLWSPSRILWNFLVYRQIDKKLHEVKGAKAAAAATNAAAPAPEPYHPYALGVGPNSASSSSALSPDATASRKNRSSSNASRPKASSLQQADGSAVAGPSRIKSDGSISETALSWASNSADPDASTSSSSDYVMTGMVAGMAEPASGDRASSPSSKREADLERSIVGSLTSSYPFAKGGLCKKTISIQVEGSTQHLISYYSVEDVRAGRLRTPSSLTELNGLTISPSFLTKTSFRFPPSVTVGPDGVLRYNREAYDNQPQKADYGSSGEGTSGSDTRGAAAAPLSSPNDQFATYDADMATPNTSAGGSGPGDSSWATFPSAAEDTSGSSGYSRPPPLPHQIGGSGHLPMARRSSDAALRTRKGSGRFEPYGSPTSNMAQGGSGVASGSGPSSLVGSPMSASATPYQSFGSALSAAQDAVPTTTRPRSASNRRLQTSRSLWNLSEISASSGAPAGFPSLPPQHAAHQPQQHHAHAAHAQQRPMSSSESSRPMADGFGPGEMVQRPATGGAMPWSSLSMYAATPALDTTHAAPQPHYFGGGAAFTPQQQHHQHQPSGSTSRAEWESRASKPSGSSSGHVNYGLGAISTYTDQQQMHHSVSDQGHEHAQELQTYPRPGSSASHFHSPPLASPAGQQGTAWRPPWGGEQGYAGAEPAASSMLPSMQSSGSVNTQPGPSQSTATWPAVYGMPAPSPLNAAGGPPGPSPPLYAEPTSMPIWAANLGTPDDGQFYAQQSARMSRASTNDSTAGSGSSDLNAVFLSRPTDGHH